MAPHLTSARELARKNAVDVHFVSSIPEDVLGSFDVVLSISAFEHFSDPEATVRLMGSYVADSGEIIITWAEPWYSHFGNFTKIPGTNLAIPWCNLFFSDRAMLTLRTRFRNDRPARVEDIEGGLNRMTVARFERIMRQSGMTIERLKLHATVGLPLVTKVPVTRELLISAATCILRREPKNRLNS